MIEEKRNEWIENEDNYWETINEQIERNKQDRFSWKKILGMSLNKAVAKFKAAGLNSEETIKTIIRENPKLSDEHKRRLNELILRSKL